MYLLYVSKNQQNVLIKLQQITEHASYQVPTPTCFIT